MTDLGVPFDLVLTVGGDTPPNKPNERYVELFPVPVCMAVPRSHRLFRRAPLTMDDLRGESVVIAQPGVSWRADQVRRSLSDPVLGLHLVERPYTFSVFSRCAREGMPMLSTDMWRNIHPDLRNIPVEWSHSFSFGAFLPRRGDELIERFLELLMGATR